MKSSLDCSLDLSVSGCSIVVRYLNSWYVGEPQKETIGRIGKPVVYTTKVGKQRKIIWWKNQYISLKKEITTELQYCNSHHNSVHLMVLYVMSEKYTVIQRNVIY